MGFLTIVRRRGNSLGVVIPREDVSKQGLQEDDEVEITVRKIINIQDIFGKYRFKNLRSLEKELREGWH